MRPAGTAAVKQLSYDRDKKEGLHGARSLHCVCFGYTLSGGDQLLGCHTDHRILGKLLYSIEEIIIICTSGKGFVFLMRTPKRGK